MNKDASLLAKIDDQEIRAEDLVRYLKLNGKFEQILDDMITDRVTVRLEYQRRTD